MQNNNSNHLQSLNANQTAITAPKQNVIGWTIKNEAGAYLGKVADLLYDQQALAVRYLVMDLKGNGMNLQDKKVMVPVGIANLHPDTDEIILPNLHTDHFNALPAYQQDQIGPDTEQYIREVIGSPAALRLAESMVAFDQQQFYAHHHFDDQKFYNRATAQTKAEQPERTVQQDTINELIKNSLQHNLHAATAHTGSNTHHNEGKKLDQKTDQENNSVWMDQ